MAGLFGKLPVKRDFVAFGLPRRIIEAWETWLQAGVAASRQALGEGWSDAYNRAPLWRFWLGADICGETALGVFMPSVDGVGRAFPLALFAGEGADLLPPPEIDSNDAWFAAAEPLLLGALDAKTDFDAFTRAILALPQPVRRQRESELAGLTQLDDGAVLIRDIGAQPSLAFRAARRFDPRLAFAAQTFWWTIGGEDFAPLALALRGLPRPARFADFLTGAFRAEARDG